MTATLEFSPFPHPRLDGPGPGPGEVHLYCASFAVSPGRAARLSRSLSAAERQRAQRFHFDRDRLAFSLSRALLRGLLAACTGAPGAALRFAYGPRGKPELAEPASPLAFNVSHTRGLVLVGLSGAGAIGVDVETLSRDSDLEGIAGRFFSPAEAAALRALAAEQRPAAFYRCWTRKEAFLKATGDGLAMGLDRFDVSLDPDRARLLAIHGDPTRAAGWTLLHLEPGPGYVGAAAVAGPVDRVSAWRLDLERLEAV